jgi:nucleotide-binding universal stress UspA family protein
VVHAATGDPAEAIIRIAEQEQAELVVVGNKGMKGRRRILGSVPNTVAHGAPCSVLIVDTVGTV